MADHCPHGYRDPHAWCAWANATKTCDDLKWIVGSSGTPMLVDDEAVCAHNARINAQRLEDERKRHNWRIMHPITKGNQA